jgi:hypothetical protein
MAEAEAQAILDEQAKLATVNWSIRKHPPSLMTPVKESMFIVDLA